MEQKIKQFIKTWFSGKYDIEKRNAEEQLMEIVSQHEIEVRRELKKKVAKMKDSHSHGAIYQQGLDDAFNEVLALLEDK